MTDDASHESLNDQVQRLDTMSAEEFDCLVSHWRTEVFDPINAKRLMMLLGNSEHWSLLNALLENPSLRSELWLIARELHRYASSQGKLTSFKDSLPANLTLNEADSLYACAIRAEDLSLAIKVMEQGGKPTKRLFSYLCDQYNKEATMFLKSVILTLYPIVDWKACLEIGEESWEVVISEALHSSSLATAVIVFDAMSESDKAALLKSDFFKLNYKKLILHLTINDSLLKNLPPVVRGEVFKNDLGI